MTRSHLFVTGLLAVLTALPGCLAPAIDPGNLEAREAVALMQRADEQLEAGDREQAILVAQRALEAARASGHTRIEASALRLLGVEELDVAQIERAATLSRAVGDLDGLARADLAQSRIFLARGRPDVALRRARTGLERFGPDDTLDYGEVLARLHHAEAAALRALGEHAAATSAQRRADLALSTLPDNAALPLRLDVALALGADLVTTDPHAAFRSHARASWFARRTSQPVAELRAVVGMAGDCLALGRRADAAAMIERALSLAVALDPPSPASVAILERNLRIHLLALEDGPGSIRWKRLDALIADYAPRLAP